MGRFEDRLWREIVRDHGIDLQEHKPRPKRRRRARPRVLAGTSLGLAGICAVIAIVLSAASSTPAFAVTRNGDGTVTVVVASISAIPQANAKLSRLGLPVRLVALSPGCAAPPPATAPVPLPALRAARAASKWRFNPHKIPAGKTLVLGAAWRRNHLVRVAPTPLVNGTPPSCLPAPTGPIPCLPRSRARKTLVPAPAAPRLVPGPAAPPHPSASPLPRPPVATAPRPLTSVLPRALPAPSTPLAAMSAQCRALLATRNRLLKHWRLQLKLATGRG